MRGTRGHTQPLQKQGKTERSSAPKLTQGATPTRLGTQRIPGQTDCGQAMGYPRNTSIHPASSRVIRRENTRLSMHPATAPCHQIIGSIPERLLDRPFPGEQMEGAAARMGLNKVVPVPKFVLAQRAADEGVPHAGAGIAGRAFRCTGSRKHSVFRTPPLMHATCQFQAGKNDVYSLL